MPAKRLAGCQMQLRLICNLVLVVFVGWRYLFMPKVRIGMIFC